MHTTNEHSGKVIITCAITGAIHTPSMSPHLPVTPEEIIAEMLAAAEAGASILRPGDAKARSLSELFRVQTKSVEYHNRRQPIHRRTRGTSRNISFWIHELFPMLNRDDWNIAKLVMGMARGLSLNVMISHIFIISPILQIVVW